MRNSMSKLSLFGFAIAVLFVGSAVAGGKGGGGGGIKVEGITHGESQNNGQSHQIEIMRQSNGGSKSGGKASSRTEYMTYKLQSATISRKGGGTQTGGTLRTTSPRITKSHSE